MATSKRRKIGSAKKSGSKRGKKLVAKKRRSKKRTRGVSLTATAALGVGMKAEAGSLVSPSPGVQGVEAKAEAGDLTSRPPPPPPPPNFGWSSRNDASIQAILAQEAHRRAFVAQMPFSSMPPHPIREIIQEEANPNRLNPDPRNITLDGFEQGQSVTLDTNVIRAADRPAILHQEVLKRIAELEDFIKKLPEPTPGIGHNRAPEPIEQTPVTPSELSEIKTILQEIKSLPAIPTQERELAGNAAITLNKISSRIWMCADDLLKGASLAAGAAVVGAVISSDEKFNIWHLFSALLSSLANAILEWLAAIPALY